MELHSILMLLFILLVIFSLTYFLNLRQKQLLKKITEKQEPRFDIVENRVPEPISDVGSEDELYIMHTSSESSANLLLDDPILQPPPSKIKPLNDSVQTKRKTSPVEEIIYFLLVAKENKPYVGYELLQALLAAGFRFGAMSIFHRHEDPNGNGKILFSIASASEPGTFEINKMGAYSGRGLMIFMRLSGNKDLQQTFDFMLEAAKQLVEDLDGDILDEERKPLSPDKIERLRKKILDFEQKQLTGDLFDQ